MHCFFRLWAKGLLTDRYYLEGIPSDSRAGGSSTFLNSGDITEGVLEKVKKLNLLAEATGAKAGTNGLGRY